MYREGEEFSVFQIGGELDRYLKENCQKIRSCIEKESEDYILNVNEIEYINYLVDKFTIDIPSIDFAGVCVTHYEKRFSSRDSLKQVIVYHLPCTGNIDLLRYSPDPRLVWTTSVYMKDQCLCFEIVRLGNDEQEIERDAHDTMKYLETQLSHLTHQIKDYNTRLHETIEKMFRARKQGFLDNNRILASLNVPIKKREDLPQTYAVPTPEIRKRITPQPVVTTTGYKPDPTLNQSIYLDILQTIHDFGKVFERYPSTYRDKNEEELRDHLLFCLEPRYEGSATGETFNKQGRTDILIRYEKMNLFIAECKFWEGPRHYLDTITQLLKYLTWRDSKAAVVVFVRNKDFSSVLGTVEETTPDHSNYLGFIDKKDESWFNYRFHINDDRNREVKLAVLLFHIPPP